MAIVSGSFEIFDIFAFYFNQLENIILFEIRLLNTSECALQFIRFGRYKIYKEPS